MGVVMRGYCPVCWRCCSWLRGQEKCNRCHKRIAKGKPPLGIDSLATQTFLYLVMYASWAYVIICTVYIMVKGIMGAM